MEVDAVAEATRVEEILDRHLREGFAVSIPGRNCVVAIDEARDTEGASHIGAANFPTRARTGACGLLMFLPVGDRVPQQSR